MCKWTRAELDRSLLVANEAFYRWTTGPIFSQVTKKTASQRLIISFDGQTNYGSSFKISSLFIVCLRIKEFRITRTVILEGLYLLKLRLSMTPKLTGRTRRSAPTYLSSASWRIHINQIIPIPIPHFRIVSDVPTNFGIFRLVADNVFVKITLKYLHFRVVLKTTYLFGNFRFKWTNNAR